MKLWTEANQILNQATDRPFWKGLAVLGAMALTKYLYKTLSVTKEFLAHLIPLEKNLLQRYGEGSWAVVTGSSDGIGKSFAFQLARRGFNVVLIARNEEKLKAVANEIQTAFPKIQTKVVVADFSKATNEAFFENIMNEVRDLDVSVLVNNVGAVVRGVFHTYKRPDILNILIVNCLPLLMLSHHFVQRFNERKQRSAMINLSSCSALLPVSLAPLYAPTKAYADYLTRSLEDKHGHKIDFLSLMPSLVTTPLTMHKKNFMSVTPDQCSNGALNHLGRRSWSFGPWKHYIFASLYGYNDFFARLYYIITYGSKVVTKLDRSSITPDMKL